MAQYQHIVPQVYLKQFGFVKKELGGKRFVSVWNIEKGVWEEKGREIKRFLGKNNIYDLNDCIEISSGIIENDLNGGIETRFPKIIKKLNSSNVISKNLHMAISETTANFLCRSLWVLDWIKGWLSRDDFRVFFDYITTDKFLDRASSDSYFSNLIYLPEKDAINLLMVFLTDYISTALQKASITIIKGNERFMFFTSDNPVILRNVSLGQIIEQDMEIYFPLSPYYLAYFYWDTAKCDISTLSSKLANGSIIKVDAETYEFFHKNILLEFVDDFIISPVNIDLLRYTSRQ